MSEENSSSIGYMAKLKAVSRQSAEAAYSDTNISAIVSLSIETYTRAFFNSDGKYRHILKQFAPGMMKYVSDDDYQGKDATKTKLSIERYSERLAANPPCIVINDSAVVLKSPGFGRSTWQSRVDPITTRHHIAVSREVPISLFIAASSKSDLTSIAQTLHTIFFDLSTMLIGKVLRPDNATDSWIVRLPLVMDAGSYDKNNQGDDPQQQLWTSTFNFTVVFEDSFTLSGEDMHYDVSTTAIQKPSILFPTTAVVGKRVLGVIQDLTTTMKVALSDINIASLSPGNTLAEYILLAKRPGVVEVQIHDGARNTDQYPGQGSSVRPNVIATHRIVISY